MTYIIFAIVIGWLMFDAFSETLVNGTPFFKAFKVRWSDRLWNASFNKKLNQYNKIIEKKGQCYSLKKQVFAYLDYDEYVTFSIYQKDRIIELEYSMTNDEIKARTIKLKDLKMQDSYYGRWMNGYCEELNNAQCFDGDYIKQIENMIELAIKEDKKSKEKEKEILQKYHGNDESSNFIYEDKISPRKQEMINLLKKELLSI